MHRLLGAVLLIFLLTSTGMTQDFRIETDLYVGANAEPDLKYLTVFVGSTTYDFRLTEPIETAIYDSSTMQITLLSSSRQIRTDIRQSELIDFMAGIKANVRESEPLLYFACNPKFATEIDETSKTIDLTSSLLSYKIQAESPKANFQGCVSRYQDFADWSSRLSAMRAGNLHLPPFARIEANRLVAQKGWIPAEVTRTTVSRSKKLELRAKHTIHWMVPDPDRRRIAKVSTELIDFKPVPYAQYAQDNTVASTKGTRR